MEKKLDINFYRQSDVVSIARALIGKILVTTINGMTTAGKIVETEAYNGIKDKACHAYGGRRTSRTSIMYMPGGVAYVYLCYGIHHLFNVVTNHADIPDAVLIRAVEPLQGVEVMLKRTGRKKMDYTFTSGPGNVSKALGISASHNSISLLENVIYIAEDETTGIQPNEILASPRIGVHYAGKDALLPYRFYLKENAFVSGKKLKSYFKT